MENEAALRKEAPTDDAIIDDDIGAETEINATFKRMLAALRRMPRHQRSSALRAAWNWRALALKALREQRSARRQDRYMLRRLQAPGPR